MANSVNKIGLVFTTEGEAKMMNTLAEVNNAAKQNYNAFQALKSGYDQNTTAVQRLTDKQKYLESQTVAYGQKCKVISNSIEELRNKNEQLRAKNEELAKSEKDNTEAIAKNERAIEKNEKAISKKITQLGQAEIQLNKYDKSLKEITLSLDSGAAKMEEYADKVGKSSEKIKNAGKTLSTYVTAPIVAAGAAALKTGADFDEQMATVQSISGATGKELEALRETAEAMGASTSFSATEAAKAFEYMGMAGFSSEEMIDAIAAVMDGAAASGEDLAAVSDIVTDGLSAFGMQANEAGRFMDVLVKTGNSANTNVSMMGETFKYAGAICGTLGISIEDTALAAGIMANQSIKAEQAGTGLRAGLLRLANPTKQTAAAMEAYGVRLIENEDGSVNLFKTMQNLRSAFQGVSKTEKAAALQAIFGTNAATAWAAVVNETDENFNSLAESIGNANGAAKEAAKIKLDNLKGDVTILSSTLEGIAIKISNVLVPAIRKVIQFITAVLQKINGMSDTAATVITVIAGIAAAIGPVLLVVGTLGMQISKIMGTIAGFMVKVAAGEGAIAGIVTTISGMIGPIMAVIAAVILVIAAIKKLWKENESFRQMMIRMADTIVDLCSRLQDVLVPVIDIIISALKNVWSGTIQPLLNNLTSFVMHVIEAIANLLKVFTPAFNVIISILGTVLPPIVRILATVFRTAFAIIGTVINMFVSVVQLNIAIFKTVLYAAVTIVKAIATLIKAAFTALADAVKSRFESIYKSISGPMQKVSAFIKSILAVIKSIFSAGLNAIKATVSRVFGALYGLIKSPMDKAKSYIKKIIDTIKGLFHFSVKWPHIPTPHFSISPSGWKIGDLLKGSIPTLGVKWYKTAMDKGMILDKATIFGADASGNLLGAGEAGSETVVGTNSLMNMIRQAVGASNEEMLRILLAILTALEGFDPERIATALGRELRENPLIIKYNNRELGRVIREYA